LSGSSSSVRNSVAATALTGTAAMSANMGISSNSSGSINSKQQLQKHQSI